LTQNIYDDPNFFRNYSGLDRSVHGLAGAAEWPALRTLLPALRNRRVVDLGCGFGWFCRHARQQGAATVLGLDVSENMLAKARTMTADPAITYETADLEQLRLPGSSFDLAYSSLAFHYIANLEDVFAALRRALAPGARLVFSVEHPIYTAPTCPGWSVDEQGRKTWPVDSYAMEGERTTDWLGARVVKHHRTLGTYLNLLIRTGFTILHVEDWSPTGAQIKASPELAEERERPIFLFISALRS
jgi:SAM-dependent methyltransferase